MGEMQPESDAQLLRAYAERGAEAAFTELVHRHTNLVYSAALRQVELPDAAAEIAQRVFIGLARGAQDLAHRLAADASLAGWLCRSARNLSLNHRRDEFRRQTRERQAMEQLISIPDAAPDWERLRRVLDDAMSELSEADYDALVLRFFQQQDFRTVGAALGVSDDTAQKRVTRALETLRDHLSRRGIRATAAALSLVITANAVQAAPAALAKTISAVAVAKGIAASGSTSTLIKGALKIMAWTKMKTAIVVGVGVLLAAGTTTITIKEIQDHRTYPWQVSKADFSVFYKMQPMVKIVPTKFSEDGSWCCDSSRGAMGIAQPLKEIIQVAYQEDKLRTVVVGDLPAGKYDFIAKLVPPEEPRKNVPTDTNWTAELQKEIRKKFGRIGRRELRDADVLLLEYKNPAAHGFQPADSLRRSMKLGKGTAVRPGPGQFAAFNQPLDTLTSFLERRLQIPIVDRTGLTNEFDFIIKWEEPDPKQPDNEALKRALSNQLGLELVPSRESIEMLVVEKVR